MILEDRDSNTVYIPIDGELIKLPKFMDWSQPVQFRIEHMNQPCKGASKQMVFRNMVLAGNINGEDVYRVALA